MNNLRKSARGVLGAFLFTLSVPALSGDWFEIARKGDIKTMKTMMKEIPSLINSRNGEKGHTAFILATYNNQFTYAQKLIELGADPCIPDNEGNTALMGVIFKGHEDIALSIIYKCNVNHQNNEGQTALMYASLFGREKIAKELISLGADKELRDSEGRTALSLAEGQWNKAMASFLKTFKIIKK